MTRSPPLPDLDRMIRMFDRGLRTLLAPPPAQRPSPADALPEADLDVHARRHAAALMRVNHAGEVCAQALYDGQALFARAPSARRSLEQAAAEEQDHLAWCADRLRQLDQRPSLLGPVWYGGSLALGALAALAGDRFSLGFLVETERQVEAHLESHLERLPPADARSRAIVAQMREDEARHADMALAQGAARLPRPLRALMRLSARVMTSGAYWV